MDPTQVRRDEHGVMRCIECGFAYNLTPSEVAEQTAQGAMAVRAAIEAIPPHRLTHRPSPDVWSVNEYTGHLADVAWMVDERTRRILEEDNPFLPNQDQNRKVDDGQYVEIDALVSVARMEEPIEGFRARLMALPDGAWDRMGTHSTAGAVQMRDVAHDLPHELHHHAYDIRRIAEA